MKKIQTWLSDHNIGLKLLSIVAAFVLWGIVISITDPTTTQTYSVQIEVENTSILTSKGLRKVEGPSTASVTLKGKRRAMASITEESFDGYASITESIEEGVTNLRCTVEVKNADVQIVSKSSTVRIVTEKVISSPVEVDIVLTGQPEQNYSVGTKHLEPNVITIEGIRSAVDAVDSARVVYDISGVKDSFSVGVVYELLDAAGNVIDTTKLDKVEPSSLTLDVTMKMDSSIPLRVNLVGTDYLATDEALASVTPANITVFGAPEVIETLNAIDLEEISLKYVVENGEYVIRRTIRIPDGVTVAGDTPEEAVITITTPGYERRSLSFTEANLPADDRFTYQENTYELILFGRTEALDLVTLDTLTFTPVVTEGMEPGEVSVPLSITSGVEGVTVLSKNSVIINMLEPPEGETEPDTEPGEEP